jgi:flavin-dependent dehydrogenase
MTVRLQSAICVIGGGPTGAAIGRRLAQLSHPVVIIEKSVFPRPHIGESLSPGLLPLLDVLGIRQRIEDQQCLRPERTLLHWPPYHGFKTLGRVPGFQVERAQFDAIMLDAAREAGALAIEGARLLKWQQNADGGWDLLIRGGEGLISAERSFVVDATGRRGLIFSKKRRYGVPTFAIYNYWEGTNISGPETRIEAGSEHWYWGAPLPNGSVNATVFVDPQHLQRDLIRLGSVETVYRELLSRSLLLSSCLDGRSSGPARVCDATCYFDETPVGADLIKVGESLFSLDPLSSQGVQTAIGTALHAAAVVNTTLRRSEDRGIASEFYQARRQEAIAFHVAAATRLYQQVATQYPSQFWQVRAHANDDYKDGYEDDSLSRSAIGRPLPSHDKRLQLAHRVHIFPLACLDGDFVVKRYAVAHPGRLRPTVFVGEVEIAPLLESFRTPVTLKEARSLWSRTMDSAKIDGLLRWSWTQGLIVETG